MSRRAADTARVAQLPEYRAWLDMHQRCRNPKNQRWHRYGGRGIRVCERWTHFANFLADMGPRPSGLGLDRIDNDGDYAPGNCRWTTKAVQVANGNSAKLTAADVHEIRRAYRPGTQSELAARFGVSQVQVGRIVRGERWRGVGGTVWVRTPVELELGD